MKTINLLIFPDRAINASVPNNTLEAKNGLYIYKLLLVQLTA